MCCHIWNKEKHSIGIGIWKKNQEDQAICATFSSVILSLNSKVPTSLCFSNFRTELLGSRSFWRYCAFALIAIAKWKLESSIAKKTRKGAEDNSRSQKSLGPLKKSLEISKKVIVPQKKKIMSRSFFNSGTLIVITFHQNNSEIQLFDIAFFSITVYWLVPKTSAR